MFINDADAKRGLETRAISARRQPTTLLALLDWVYRRQRADLMTCKPLKGPKRQDDGTAPDILSTMVGASELMDRVAELGVMVDGGGRQSYRLHEDAERVHDALIALSESDWAGAALILGHARIASQPDWGNARQEWEPVRDANGRIIEDRFDEVVMLRTRGRPRRVQVSYCPVAPYPSDEWVAMTRGEYRCWHQALVSLSQALPPLTLWKVVGLGVQAEPWVRED